MPFSLWDPNKNEDYNFIDGVVEEQFDIGGTSAFIYKYLGPVNQGNTGDVTQPSYIAKNGKITERDIQDLAFMENRDRNYDLNEYEIKVVYQVQDNEFDLKQFSLFIDIDTIYIELHLNGCLRKLGRKLLSGDVVRFPHMRDDALLDPDAPAIDRYYVVEDVGRGASGFSPTWFPHILRAKLKPMKNAQEYSAILNQKVDPFTGEILPEDSISPSSTTLGDIISDYNSMKQISDAMEEQANIEVPARNFETRHYYFKPAELGDDYPWVFTEDGAPPDGLPLQSGSFFPDNSKNGDWFLRTDYEPEILFRKEGSRWQVKEHNLRKPWESSHRILTTFLNNNTESVYRGEVLKQKQAVSKILKPRADF